MNILIESRRPQDQAHYTHNHNISCRCSTCGIPNTTQNLFGSPSFKRLTDGWFCVRCNAHGIVCTLTAFNRPIMIVTHLIHISKHDRTFSTTFHCQLHRPFYEKPIWRMPLDILFLLFEVIFKFIYSCKVFSFWNRFWAREKNKNF